MKKGNIYIPMILITIGVLSLVNNIFGMKLHLTSAVWSLFILIPGIYFQSIYFCSNKYPTFLVPGGMLMVLGTAVFFDTLTGGIFMEFTWPLYPLSVAFGIYQLYRFHYKKIGKRQLLIPVKIITYTVITAYTITMYFKIASLLERSIILPLIFILIGFAIIFKDVLKDWLGTFKK